MQVTSLLAPRDQTPSTKTYWWKRKRKANPDVIDIEEIKPNPIVAWVKRVRWLNIVAIIIQRIGRCMDKTNPGPMMVGGIVGAIGVMCTVMPFDNTPHTYVQLIWHCIWFSGSLVIIAEALIYLSWEFYQLCQWLHQWANRTHPNPYRD